MLMEVMCNTRSATSGSTVTPVSTKEVSSTTVTTVSTKYATSKTVTPTPWHSLSATVTAKSEYQPGIESTQKSSR